MDQLCGGVLERQKDSVILGTYESSAFILSLRNPEEFSTIHSFGCHCIPHVGVYGKDYTISLPMVLLSLPTTHRTLQVLPSDLLGALDLDYLLTPTQNPLQLTIPSLTVETSPRHTTQALLRENILTFQRVYSGTGMSPECIVAKALVHSVLHSAQSRLAPPIFTFGARVHNVPNMNPNRSFLSINNSTDGTMEWRETKRYSSGSFRGVGLKVSGAACKSASGISMDSEGCGSTSTDCSNFPTRTERRKVSFHIGGEEPTSVSMDTREVVDEKELRVVAKKLVMKILHMACKEVESLNRRSSIEYLIASTKRMKIEESPSPPPALFNIAEEQDGVDPIDGNNISNPFSELRSVPTERSPTPEHLLLRRLGKKRGRSGSHEVSGLREFIETSRRSKVVRKIIKFKERIMGGFQQPTSGGSVKSPTKSNDDSSSQSGDEGTSFTSLISNMSRMSIGPPTQHESDTESEATSINDESFTILSAVTVSEDPLAGLRDETSTSNASKKYPFQEVHASSHQKTNHVGLGATASPFSAAHNSTPSPLATQCNSSANPFISSSSGNSTHGDAQDSIIPDMDLFVIIHSRPNLGRCQKFLCSNTNEVNLMYHCWMYPNVPFDPSMAVSGKLEMGVFEPSFVQPVHLDLQDAGIAFYFLDERTVCIHNCCFSPENAQLQLTPVLDNSSIVHSFYSAARLGSRRVAAFHIIPPGQQAEQRIRECAQKSSSLGQLLERLKSTFPDVGHKVQKLVMP